MPSSDNRPPVTITDVTRIVLDFLAQVYRKVRAVPLSMYLPVIAGIVFIILMVLIIPGLFTQRLDKSFNPSEFARPGYTVVKSTVIALTNQPSLQTMVEGPFLAVSNGWYRVSVQVSNKTAEGVVFFLMTRGGTLYSTLSVPGNYNGWLSAELPAEDEQEYALAARIQYNGKGNLAVTKIRIERLLYSPARKLQIAVLSVFLAVVLFLYFRPRERRIIRLVIRKFASTHVVSRLDRYIYRDLFLNYLFGLLFFTLLLMLNQLFFMAKLYVQHNVPLGQVLMLLFNLVPFIMTLSGPFGVMPAFLITMGRLSQDSEIIALRACGVSTFRILRPGIIFGISLTVFMFLFNDMVSVPSTMNYFKMYAKIMAQKPAADLRGNSSAVIGNYRISYDRSGIEDNVEVLYNIHIVDVAGRKTIEAEKGRLYINPENPAHYILKFMNGTSSEVVSNNKSGEKPEESFFVVSFKYLALNTFINLPDDTAYVNADSMTLDDLRRDVVNRSRDVLRQLDNYLDDEKRVRDDIQKTEKQLREIARIANQQDKLPQKQQIEDQLKNLRGQVKGVLRNIEQVRKNLPLYNIVKLNEKIALPLACFVFSVIGLALGFFSARSGRGEGLGISIVVVLLYYGMKYGLDILVQKNYMPIAAVWIPNLLFFIIGSILIIRKARE